MTLGEQLGFAFADGFDTKELFACDYGTIILELNEDVDLNEFVGAYELGSVIADKAIICGDVKFLLMKLKQHTLSHLNRFSQLMYVNLLVKQNKVNFIQQLALLKLQLLLLNQEFSFQYSQVQTVNMILLKHLIVQVVKLKLSLLKT